MQGGASWLVLTLSAEALDCWHLSHTGGKHDISMHCVWSLALGVELSRFDRRASDADALKPLRLEVQRDTVCVLAAIRQPHKHGVAPEFDLVLAFLKLPRLSGSGVWGAALASGAL
jgi:hypothetical protein